MTDTKSTSFNPLEQFVLLAKSAKGAAAVELVKQALEAPGVYVFGELLDMPNISEVLNIFPNRVVKSMNLFKTSCFPYQLQVDQFQPYYNLLKLFAFGTYRQYLENKDTLPELTVTQEQKLRHLTIVTLSETNKVSKEYHFNKCNFDGLITD